MASAVLGQHSLLQCGAHVLLVGLCHVQYNIYQEVLLHLHSLWGGFVLMQVFEWVKNHGGEPIIPFSGVFESKLVDMPDDERDKYCKEVRLAAFATDMLAVQGRFCTYECCTCMHGRVVQAAPSMLLCIQHWPVLVVPFT